MTLLDSETTFNNAMERAARELDRACQMVLAAGWPPERCRIVEQALRIKRTLWVDYRETDGKPDGVPVFEIEVVSPWDGQAPLAAAARMAADTVYIEVTYRWLNNIPEYRAT